MLVRGWTLFKGKSAQKRTAELRKLFNCATAISKTQRDADDIRGTLSPMIGPEKIP